MRDRITPIIKNRTVAIMLHGASIEELEKYIVELKDYDICWTSLGVFTMMEDFILSKIGKRLDIVYDSATVSGGLLEYYEKNVRFPRINEFLSRADNNLWITTHGLILNSVKRFYPNVITQYGRKIQRVDNLFPKERLPEFMDVPNSATLLLASVLAGGAKKIIFFGLDGYKGPGGCPASACYHPELIEAERKVALGNKTDEGITRDTRYFQKRLPKIVREYRLLFGNYAYIYNCSPRTVYDMIRKIKYEELKSIL